MTTVSFQELTDDHRLIERLADNIVQLMSDAVPNIDEILSVRLELSAEIRAHWALEDALMKTWAASERGRDSYHYVKGLALEYRSFREEWDEYLYEWGAESIAADWRCFCDQTRKIIKRMSDKAAAEDVYIYPLALKIGIIPRND